MKTCILTGLMAGFFWSASGQSTAVLKPTRPTTATTLQPATAESVGMSTDRLHRMDAIINDYIAQGRQAGVAVLVARNGRVVYHQAYGLDDAARMVSSYIKAADTLSDFAGWCLSYNDPTGRTAARNVDRERGTR